MSEPLFVDQALARALEGGEAACCTTFCQTAARLYPSMGMRTLPCAGGSAQFYGPSHPISAVKGVGLAGPVAEAEWTALEDVFRATGSPVVVDLCPLADSGFVSMLCERGYRIGSFETVTCRRLAANEPLPIADARGATIEVVDWNRAEECGRVIEVAFADGGEPMAMGFNLSLVRAHTPQSLMLLALVDGVPAGGAALSMHAGVVHLAGGAVLPAYRGRGIQRALTSARLRLAAEHGCTLAKLDVLAGSVSHRNAVRSGFQVAYTRPQMVRTW